LPAQRLLSRPQAARYCGMSAEHFTKHVPVAPIEFGKRKLYDRNSLDQWIDKLTDSGDVGRGLGRGLGDARKNSAH
jgi:hypothetical protein